MYLKSLSIKNYRKFGDNAQNIDFAHDRWPKDMSNLNKEAVTEGYISKSSTLVVGKNNAGKSTIVKLLDELSRKKSGSRKVFKSTDFNLKVLKKWYDDYVYGKSIDEINSIDKQSLPTIEFQLVLGIDEENDVISKFEDILIIDGLNLEQTNSMEDVSEITFLIKYEVGDTTSFIEEIIGITEQTVKKNQLSSILSTTDLDLFEKEDILLNELEVNFKSRPDLKLFIDYQKELQYRKFLDLFSSNYFVLNFYPDKREEPAKDFSLVQLLKVKTIEANTVKDDKTLSKAYNKIVSTYVKNKDITAIAETVGNINYQVKQMVDGNIKDVLQDAVSSIESVKNLEMNLQPDVTLAKLFINSIIYEYREQNNHIPENQFGMGYTNLMVIIAEIVDYIELYSKDDINSAINILCIEEPESFMHPQMQELFIKNIAKAIAKLLGKKDQLDTFQIVITTHSPHILNSKIHSGNTLNNISYLSSSPEGNIVKNLSDKHIIDRGDVDKKKYEYIKKYLRLEASDIFFTDAVVLVEGVSEETYVRFLLDQHNILKNYHIKVYRIDGAYAHRFAELLSILEVKTIIFTDLDLKRTDEEKKINIGGSESEIIPRNISNLDKCVKDTTKYISTNGTVQYFVKKELNDDKATIQQVNTKIIELLNNKEELIISYNNISMHSQGKIHGYYATSFEEAIVLTNAVGQNKGSLIKLLKHVHQKMKYFGDLKLDSEIAEKSYMYQVKLSDGKSKFSTGIVYLSTIEEDFELTVPTYIKSGLELLCSYFEE